MTESLDWRTRQMMQGESMEKAQPIHLVQSMIHSLYKGKLADNVVADIFKISLPAGNAVGLGGHYSFHAYNGTNWYIHTGQLAISIVTDDGATYSSDIVDSGEASVGTGGFTDTWGTNTTGLKDGEVNIHVTPNPTMTGTPVTDLHMMLWMSGKWRFSPL